MSAHNNTRQPVIFISHGSPMTALEKGAYAQALTAFGNSIAPNAILVISAHWQEPEIRIASSARPEPIYDFGGFPRELYELTYPAPGSPELAKEAALELGRAGFEAILDPERGWDHGLWVPLRLMFPEARIPVVQVSLPMRWLPSELYRVGEALRESRGKGVLIVGSGGIVHNLRLLNWVRKDASPDAWAEEFQQWVRSALERHDLQALFDYAKQAPHAALAAPTPEHFIPIFPVLGAAGEYSRVIPIFEGIEYGNMSMYSFCLED